MNRLLQWFNLIGVVALTALCVVQWRTNRTLNLELNQQQKLGEQTASRLKELARQMQGGAADLEEFRQRVAQANSALQAAEARRAALEPQLKQLRNERDQLKTSVTNWAAAVAARDDRLKQAGADLARLGSERNEAVRKFNELAVRQNQLVAELERRAKEHTAVVQEMNKRTVEHNRMATEMNQRAKTFNELVDKYNALAKQLEAKPGGRAVP